MTIDVEISDVAVQAFTNQIRHVTQGQNVRAPIQRHAILEAQALAGFHFFENRLQASIVDYWFHWISPFPGSRPLNELTVQQDISGPKNEE